MIDLNFLRDKEIKAGKNAEVVKAIDSLYDDTIKMYRNQHRDWYINDRFVRGEHWIIYNKTANKIQALPVRNGEVRRTVNKIRSQIRGVKNFIKRSQPRWEVHPNAASDEAYKEAEGKNKILQNIYRKRQLKQKITDLTINALKYSVGFLEGGVVKKNGKDIIDFWVNSTYDILPDPYANSIKNCRYIFKTFTKPVEAIKSNKDYKVEKDGLVADDKEAAAEYKDMLEKEKYNRDGNKQNKNLQTTIVKELWLKWDEEDETKVKVITIAGNTVLRVYTPKYRRYPFFAYNPERSGDSIFSEPWIKDLISINKSLDKTASQIEAYIQRMLAGKFLIKKGVEISPVTDKGAEMIYYKGSVPPRQLDLQPLPAAPFTYVANTERWIEELGGVRDASLGRSSGSLQSGKGIEALQSADAGVVAEPIENLETCLQEVGEFVLELIADHNIASETIIEGKAEVTFIGEVADAKLENTTVIKGDEEVKVMIVPEVSYSESEKKEWTMRLAEAGLIDERTLLEQFKFSNISEIIQRMEVKKDEDYKQEMMKQRESHRTSGEAPTDSAELVDQENMQLAAKQNIPATPQALWTPEHLALHIAFIKENPDAYEQNKEGFDSHIEAEQKYQE